MLYECYGLYPKSQRWECPYGYYVKKALVQLAYGRLYAS